jgi:hypothetical protein
MRLFTLLLGEVFKTFAAQQAAKHRRKYLIMEKEKSDDERRNDFIQNAPRVLVKTCIPSVRRGPIK